MIIDIKDAETEPHLAGGITPEGMRSHKELCQLVGSLELCSTIRSISNIQAKSDDLIVKYFIMCTFYANFFTSNFTPIFILVHAIVDRLTAT